MLIAARDRALREIVDKTLDELEPVVAGRKIVEPWEEP